MRVELTPRGGVLPVLRGKLRVAHRAHASVITTLSTKDQAPGSTLSARPQGTLGGPSADQVGRNVVTRKEEAGHTSATSAPATIPRAATTTAVGRRCSPAEGGE